MTTHVEERPKISDAVKNYLSFRLASALAPLEPADTESGVDALPSPTELQAMARSLLLAVNRETLPSEFAQIMRTLPNGKPTRVFGRTLLAHEGFYASVRARALNERATTTQPDALALFLDHFETSFSDGIVDRDAVSLGELVWAEDFAAALRERGARRAERAAAAAETDGSEGAADTLRELLQPQPSACA